MTKPHEEEWEQDEHDPGWMIATAGGRREVAAMFGRMTEEPNPKDIARGRLASKAPKMARVLLGPNGTGHHSYNPQRDEFSCWWCAHWAPLHSEGCETGKVLREAGVLE